MQTFSCPLMLLLALAAVAPAQTRPSTAPAPSKVSFRTDGISLLNGKPFFPVAIWVYELNSNVIADLHEHQFNTVIGNGFGPDTLDTLRNHGLMAVPIVTDAWIEKGMKHPSLLAWYLSDEPEGRKTPEEIRKGYLALRQRDPDHPIGLDHYLWEGLAQYKDGCDFSMTDVYPILANRDGIIENVGKFVDEARRIHGPNWPHWTFIQDFGGPQTDGGKWAQPLPHEVRCMTFIALVHRATGILGFSYWPQAPTTWNSITLLNRDIHRITPWLLAEGEEMPTRSDSPAIQIRAKKVGQSWLIIAVNTRPQFVTADLEVPGIDGSLPMAFAPRTVQVTAGRWRERFGPFEERTYVLGQEPQLEKP